jgi:hypothetical protein
MHAPEPPRSSAVRSTALAAAIAALLAAGPSAARAAAGHTAGRVETPAPPVQPDPAAPDPAPPEAEPVPPPQPPAQGAEHGATAGEALAFFMSSRDYRTIRELKSIMSPALKADYDKDPTRYNGRKGIRLSAFDYKEPVPKPGATSAAVTVKSLWEDQGEAVEVRTETVRLTRPADDPWRVNAVDRVATQPVRFKESVAGVTALRMVLRAWVRRDFETAKGLMSESFLQRHAGREEGIEAVFAGDPAVRRAAFRILDLTPRGTTSVTARVRLVETPPGRPSGLEGTPKSLVMAKKGSRWLLDDWR